MGSWLLSTLRSIGRAAWLPSGGAPALTSTHPFSRLPTPRRILWLDAGTRIPEAAAVFRRLSPAAGLLSTPTHGPIRRYIHHAMLRRFDAEALEASMATLCNGAFVGFDTRSAAAMAVLLQCHWRGMVARGDASARKDATVSASPTLDCQSTGSTQKKGGKSGVGLYASSRRKEGKYAP